ncbi:MAG TPA: alpha/beta hydrolase [Blastocatellia bacterium]|nr:alpha/beta hydrolase [Blastocatellia bacterium]
MKALYCLIIAFVVLTTAPSTFAQQLPAPILLWPGGAPGATGTSDEDKPAITPVLPAEADNTGVAVLVCPGGGFTTRAVDHEGVLVSQWFRKRGIASFILRYRIRPLYTRREWLMDAQRAMQHIRAHAGEFRVSSDRIGIVGFSAGADLAWDAALNPLPGLPESADAVERVTSRPDFQVLVYGASPQRGGGEVAAKVAAAPPAFMFCTTEDASHVRGMASLYGELVQAKVPVEAHFFQNGEHGVGFALGDPVLGEYPNLLMKWMVGNGFLTDKPRGAVTGVVRLDGAPLVRGIVILTSVDQPTAPPLVAYITNTGTGELGRFSVGRKQGLVAGRYRVEVRQDATRWLSNSRDPVMIRMTEKMHSGTLTDEDRREWGEYVRKRDLSPSIEDQRVYRRRRPHDQTDYIVEIKAGENILNLEVFSR